MNSPATAYENLDKLILVAGHAVYQGKDSACADRGENWVLGGFPKEEAVLYIEHIRFAVELAASQPTALLVFSGGQTRLDAGPLSEGRSYWILADQFSWWQKCAVRARATAEEFARDSFENLLFGIARFRECAGHYPESVEVVGWEFKRKRFDFHRETLGWPGSEQRYRYHGVNDPNNLDAVLESEAKTLEAFKLDPFGTKDPLRAKRARRNPFQQQPPYVKHCPEIADLLNRTAIERLRLGKVLPWNT